MAMIWVYLLASKRNGTIYLGVTNNLVRRVAEHKKGKTPGFTKKYGVTMLVWYEGMPYHAAAIQREKQMKSWRREWKVALIEKTNPEWKDLYDEIAQG